MAAAANNAWRDLLVRCGIAQACVPAFNAALGANALDALSSLPLDKLKRDLETVGKNQANVNLISTAADFDQQALDRFLQIVVWLGKIDKEMEQDRVSSLVPTLKNASQPNPQAFPTLRHSSS
jgi:hypothetical protein